MISNIPPPTQLVFFKFSRHISYFFAFYLNFSAKPNENKNNCKQWVVELPTRPNFSIIRILTSGGGKNTTRGEV